MLGTYYFKYAIEVHPVVRLRETSMRVEIVAETEKRYRVKYLNWHPTGARPGSLHWVQKRKVRFDLVSHHPLKKLSK